MDVDNTTVVSMQVLDPEGRPAVGRYRVPRWMFLTLGLLLVALITAGFTIAYIRQDGSNTIQALANNATIVAASGQEAANAANTLAQQATGTAAAQTATAEVIAAYTPTPTPTNTPTPTPQPTPIAREIGAYFAAATYQPFIPGETITATEEGMQISIHAAIADIEHGANFYAARESVLHFDAPTILPGIELNLRPGSDLFVQSGDYEEVEIRLAGVAELALYTTTAASCLGVEFELNDELEPERIIVSCYRGACKAQLDEQEHLIAVRQQLHFVVAESLVPVTRSMARTEANRYQQLLGRTAAGRQDYQFCIRPLFPPLPTATPEVTSTPITATATITPTNTPTTTTGMLTTTTTLTYVSVLSETPTSTATATPTLAPPPAICTPSLGRRDCS
jgi:hypothetical protein